MIDGLRVLAVVPARGGSKGLPRKNILALAGRPLIAWTIAAARDSQYVDRCVISTDDAEIAEISRTHGGDVPFLRPDELAHDSADTFGAIRHAIEQLPGFDIVLILQPTSPLRSSADIDGTLLQMQASTAPACVSVTEPSKSPYWCYRVNDDNCLVPLLDPKYSRMRRQDLPQAYALNGAVYAARVDWLLQHQNCLSEQTVAYVMPAERSVDIDTAFDLGVAELYLQQR